MKTLLSNLLLAFVWAAAFGRLDLGGLSTGFVVGYAVLWLAQPVTGRSRYFVQVWRLVELFLFFAWELTKGSVRVAAAVLSPKLRARPAVVDVPLELESDVGITILSNLVSLTPGSLTLDVSDDRRHLFVHALTVSDPDRYRDRLKAGFERRILEVLR